MNFNAGISSVPITTTTSASPNSSETSNSQRETTHSGRLPSFQSTWRQRGQVSFVEDLLAENSVHPEWETRLNQNYVDNQPSLHTEDDQDSSELLLSEINIDNLPLTLRYMGNVDDLDLLPATTIAPPIISTLRDPITETAESEIECAGKAKATPLIKAHKTAVQKKTRPKKKRRDKSCDGERKYVCRTITINNEMCGKSFSNQSNLKRHEMIHTEEKHYACNFCNKLFAYKYSLARHEKIHIKKHVLVKYVCDAMTIHNKICGKSWASRSALKDHKRSHTEEKPYVCKICDKKFKRKGSLVCHERIHTGKKLFSCDICNQKFRQKNGIRIHKENKHNAKNSHMCTLCDTKFSTSACLRKHMFTHTGKKPYACKECPQTFARKDTLLRHRSIHTGEKPFSCSEIQTEKFSKISQEKKTQR